MENLIAKQKNIENELDRCIRNYKKANKNSKSSPGYLNKRIEGIETEWEKFKETHNEMLEIFDPNAHKDLPYFIEDKLSAVEDKVFEILGMITDRLEEIQTGSKSSSQDTSSHVQASSELQLPRINLPRFSGDYKSWPSFHDLFVSLINSNKALTSVQKLHYLKSNLSGDAEQLIRHLQITSANYEPAWNLLVRRYQNKRALLNVHLKTLFTLPQHISESANALKLLLDTTRECLEAVKGLGIETETWDPIIIYNLTQKLSMETLSQWELTLSKRDDPSEIPSLDEFPSFIEVRFRTLEAVGLAKSRQPFKERSSLSMHGKKENNSKETFITVSKPRNCQLCKGDHLLKDCSRFLSINLNDRRTAVHKFSLCYNCLAPGHPVTKCLSKYKCRVCSGRHHTLLHADLETKQMNQANSSKLAEDSLNDKTVHTSSKFEHMDNTRVSLATALILARNSEGYCIPLRALLDQGSEANFITQAATQRLRLQGNHTSIRIKGVGGTELAVANKSVQFTLCSHYDSNVQISAEALVLPELTSVLPSQNVNNQSWTHLDDLFLADPIYFKPGKIDVLLGANIYAQVLEEGIRKGAGVAPLAQLTSLGWIVSGGFEPSKFPVEDEIITALHCQSDLESLLRRFWEVEEGPIVNTLSDEEKKCEQLYKDTVTRNKDGRYTVRLPFKNPTMIPDLGESKEIALRQLMQIERRLERNPDLFKQYSDFMKDYYDQGHMEILSNEIPNAKSNYLPHHFVTKDSSTTTKLRVVFDASRKTSNRKSLNDNLLVGPTVQEDLFSILTRWRKYKIAFTADIKQMYRQVLIHKGDADYQRILWRLGKDDPVSEFRLLTVTYGTSSAPYLATRTLQQLAKDEAEHFPNASYTALNDFYVDDVLSGGDTIPEVIKLQKDLKLLLKRGRFELRKWAANTQEVLLNIPTEERELSSPLDMTKDINIKTLGIHWDPARDTFTFKLNSVEYKPPTTKRSLLSSVAKIFDPLGWLSPIILTAKVLLQSLWMQNLEWDSTLPSRQEEQWKDFCCNLKEIEEYHIPRWMNYSKDCRSVELHVYSDASMRAYAACVYARIVSFDNTIHTILLTAKTKVAPIKPLTLPRLELCGALLGTKLVKNVITALKIQYTNIYSWTDSKVVLVWVKSHPADCASRGLSPGQLKEHSLWWFGPQWLREENDKWPQSNEETHDTDFTRKESRNVKTCNAAVTTPVESSLAIRCSSWSKLTRVVAYSRRFYNNLKASHKDRQVGHLKVKELRDAEKCLLRLCQKEDFHEEIDCLQKNKPLKSRAN